MKKHVVLSGSMRSGTTLVGAVLNAHSEFGIVSDTLTWFFKRCFQQFGPMRSEYELDNALYQMAPFIAHHRCRLNINEVRNKTIQKGISYHNLYTSLIEAELGCGLPDYYGIKSTHAAFQYQSILDGIPNSYIIHMVRDIRDVYASHRAFVKKGAKQGIQRFKRALNHVRMRGVHSLLRKEITLDEVAFTPLHFIDPLKIIDYWAISNTLAFDLTHKYQSRIAIIKYEDLIQDVEGTTKSIFHKLGAPFEQGVCNYENLRDRNNNKWKANTSFGSNSISGFDASRIGKGRAELSKQERDYVNSRCSQAIELLGYNS